MNTFTASNEIVVKSYEDNRIEIKCSGFAASTHNLSVSEAEALREFFRAEEDERLGRWRWPVNLDYVVYTHPEVAGMVVVFDERTRERTSFSRPSATGSSLKHRAVRAYFDAHPEPKPWHKAEPGQVWLVNGKVRAVVERAREPHTFADPFSREVGIPVTDPSIVDARRITWEPTS